jgi:hypothetical protein
MGLPGFSAETALHTSAGRYVTFGMGSTFIKFTASKLAYLRGDYGVLGLCGGLGQRCCRAPESAQNIAADGPLVACNVGLGCDITTNTEAPKWVVRSVRRQWTTGVRRGLRSEHRAE